MTTVLEARDLRSGYATGDVLQGVSLQVGLGEVVGVLGRNGVWGSEVVDTSSAEWSSFLLDRVIEPLWTRGYRGFFLDTLDSYERVVPDVQGRTRHARRIGALVGSLKRRHPDAKVILNRGFEILPYSPKVDGFVVESRLDLSLRLHVRSVPSHTV